MAGGTVRRSCKKNRHSMVSDLLTTILRFTPVKTPGMAANSVPVGSVGYALVADLSSSIRWLRRISIPEIQVRVSACRLSTLISWKPRETGSVVFKIIFDLNSACTNCRKRVTRLFGALPLWLNSVFDVSYVRLRRNSKLLPVSKSLCCSLCILPIDMRRGTGATICGR